MKSTRRAFLEKMGAGVTGLYLASSLALADSPSPATTLPRATPESQGLASTAIIAFIDAIAAGKHEFHSFMLVRHGHVIAEAFWAPYSPDLNHTMYSMSKSFTSTAIGLAVADGKLTVEDPVTKFFPEDLPATIDDNLAALRVKHLLTMSVGHAKDSTGGITSEENWPKAFLATPITHAPGSVFQYDSGATYMLSAIVQQVTGKKVIDFLTPRLFEPLAIEGMTWQTCPRGINTGGWGLSIRTEGLAKFGQLYLQKGNWKGKQLIPEKWIEEATSFKIQQPIPAKPTRPNEKNDWLQGYCYQFWRSQNKAYRGDGAFGQYTLIMPEQDAVLAVTSETPNMQGELDLVWEHLVPNMKDAPLPENKPASAELQKRLATLTLAPATTGQITSPRAAQISSKPFALDPNADKFAKLSITFEADACLLRLSDDESEYTLAAGPQRWIMSDTTLPHTPPSLNLGKTRKTTTKNKLAAAYTWPTPDTLQITTRYIESPHHEIITCAFTDTAITATFTTSLANMNPTHAEPRLTLSGNWPERNAQLFSQYPSFPRPAPILFTVAALF